MANDQARRVVPEPPWEFDKVGPGELVWHVEHKSGGWMILTGQSFQSGDGLALFRDDHGVSTYPPIADIKQIRVQTAPDRRVDGDS